MSFKHWAWATAFALGPWGLSAAETAVGLGVSPMDDAEVERVFTPRVAYPKVLFDSGNAGRVTALITVMPDAHPEAIEITYSQHPAFEEAAIDAVLASRYRPAVQNGRYIASQVGATYIFTITRANNGPEMGYEPFSFPAKGHESLPPEFQYDKPPSIRVLAPLVYPFELMRDKVTGSAEVAITIDPNGDVYSAKVLSATHPLFGEALKAMLSTTTFLPAEKKGKASWSVLRYQKSFDLFNRDLVPSASTVRLLDQVRQHSEAGIYKLGDLDKRPKAFFQPVPVYPQALQKAGIQGRAVVEFYVDKDGHAQLPRIVQADNEALGWVAATTVKRWRFEAPRVKGERVDTRLTVPMSFESPPSAP